MMANDAVPGVHLDDAVAVIGLACRFPGAPDADAFWRLLIEQRDAVTSMPEERFDRAAFDDRRPGDPEMIAVRRGGFLRDVDRFDADFFGISPREAEAIDPQQRLLLETAWEAIEDAGLTRDLIRGSSTGVFVGLWTSDYERIAAARGDVDLFAATGTGRYAGAGRLSYAFDLRGPSLTVDTACSSSLVALHLACQSLRAGESDLAIVGAANLILDPLISVAYSRSGLLSRDGRCRFAEADASGYVRSEGVAVLVLQRAAAATRDGNRIRSTVLGTAVNNDGAASGSLVAPSIEGQTTLVRTALAAARVHPGRVQYVEAHGTGTRVGDPVELAALAAALGPSRDRPCPVGSVKTNIGHAEAAAGLAGLIKVVLALEHGVVPASLIGTHHTEDFDWSAAGLRPCTTPMFLDASPAIAAVSSFGITGTNAHAVLCQAVPSPAAPPPGRRPHLVPVSSHSASALDQLVEDWRRQSWERCELRDIAFTASLRRSHRRHRRAVVADDVGELKAQLGVPPTTTAEHPPSTAPVFVFSGHGSQWAGMGRALLEQEPVAAEALQACARAIRACGGPPVVEFLTRADATVLTDVGVVQPLIFALQVALARTWISWGVVPGACVGHSMGEVAAAHIAGILTLDDAARIICTRSALLARRRGRGAMALIESPVAEVEGLIAPYGGRLSIAAINDAHATVVSGDGDAVAQLLTEVEATGGFGRRVQVDVAAHSAQVDDLVGELERAVAATRPSVADRVFYSTITGDRFTLACDAAYWAHNLRAPVQFRSALQAALRDGFRAFVEISPHPIAAASVRQEARDRGVEVCVAGSLRRDCDDRRSLLEAAAQLFNAGYDLNWGAIAPSPGAVVSLPPPRWERSRFWLDRRSDDSRRSNRPSETKGARDHGSPGIFEFAWDNAPASGARRVSGRWLVVDDTGLAGALVAAAGRRDVHVETVSAQRCAEYLSTGDVPSDVIVVMPAFASWRDAEWPAVEPEVLQSIDVVRSLAMPLTGRATPARLWLLTTNALGGVQGTAVDPVNTGLAALFRVVLEEHPELAGGVVDCGGGLDAEGAATVVAHLLEPDAPREVVIAGPRRLVRRLVEVQRERRAVVAVRPDATYLLTGGFGGVGMALAERLAERGARHLALAGRSGLPARADWSGIDSTTETGRRVAAVRALESRGVVVHVLAVDVGDPAAITATLNTLASVAPPVAGIVHAAAVVHDGLALECTRGTFAAVLRAKGGGAWNLLRHYSDSTLDFFVCCSSVGSLIGITGQASYAAANGLLDGLAMTGGWRSGTLSSINWGVWHETGLQTTSRGARETAVALDRDGLGAFDRVSGVDAFETVVASAMPSAAVFTLDRPRLAQSALEARSWVGEDGAAGPASTPSRGALRRQLEGLPAAERHRVLGGELRLHLARILRTAADKIPVRAPFGALGLESLMALELQRSVEHLLDEKLPKTLAWRSPTLEALTEHLLARLFPAAAGAAPPPPSRPSPSGPAMTERDALAALLMRGEGR
jgi:acyl transferase domain-containing protein